MGGVVYFTPLTMLRLHHLSLRYSRASMHRRLELIRAPRSTLLSGVAAPIMLVLLCCGGRSLLAASNDNNVEWDGLLSDQGPLYMSPTEPTAHPSSRRYEFSAETSPRRTSNT